MLPLIPHRRWNPLNRSWVLVSPQRLQRPWQGKVEEQRPASQLRYDPHCYLCPGNIRAHGERNLQYESTFVFDNDYPALLPSIPNLTEDQEGLLIAKSECGICRVICFSPRHDLAIPLMTQTDVQKVIEVWVEHSVALARMPGIGYVQIFENRGASMGASNPHPHCQVWASGSVPDIPATEVQSFREYRKTTGSCLLCEYLQIELNRNERVVLQNASFAVVVPYWAVWPFETLLLSKRHLGSFAELSVDECCHLADALRRITARYDNLFKTQFPYSMGFHQRPSHEIRPEFHFHAHYYPPLLRSASIQKFMVGYEMLASPQRDLTPESAAELLLSAPEKHFLADVTDLGAR